MYRSLVVLLAAALFAGAAHAAKMYRWVDENGVTHYSTRQPPRENSDKTRLQGGTVDQAPSEAEFQSVPKIQRKDLTGSGWRGCRSDLCRLTQRLDPQCETSYCSRARHYSESCTSFTCQTKKLAFEQEVQDRLEAKEALRRQQAINANAVPKAPGSQNQD